MSETVIQIEGLSKSYRLGVIGGKLLFDDVNRYWARLMGKPDPYSIVGQSGFNTLVENGTGSDEIWALKDITFDVKRGEVLGIIGRNGAGKSTLLKILSRVTAPTSGEIRIKGRIASLLEVGTGFQYELTGHENIFINGAILGMTKAEIKNKFDEIVDFSGCGRYIDTPVKRYSSGMIVRLAFAVAAHLEPEILVVDEVLAVGDVEFQKRATGKMQNMSMAEGRTVLFVSHDMNAISNLCSRLILLDRGVSQSFDSVKEGIDRYLDQNNPTATIESRIKDNVSITKLEVTQENKPANVIEVFKEVIIKGEVEFLAEPPPDMKISLFIRDAFGQVQTTISTWLNSIDISPETPRLFFECRLTHGFSLIAADYSMDLSIYTSRTIDFNNIFAFQLVNSLVTGYKHPLKPQVHGKVYTPNEWQINS